MDVLIACESSGAVRRAFRALGHNAWSCDFLPADDGSDFHFQGDCLEFARSRAWDLMIAHPPCTYLAVSGMHWTRRGLRDPQLTENALAFVEALMAVNIPRIAIENPVSIISTRIRKPDQIIQPWLFGDNASKKTCLWLKGLGPLRPALDCIVPPAGWELVRFAADLPACDWCGDAWCETHNAHFYDCARLGPTNADADYCIVSGILFGTRIRPAPRMIWANQTPSGQNKLGPSPERWKKRSATYPGIAAAMAAQWGARD